MPDVYREILENPVIQRIPQGERQWGHWVTELAKRLIPIGADGVMVTERSLPQVVLSNNTSVQDVSPVTGSDAGSSATISIASHLVSSVNRSISYNSGSITGLSYGTEYFIYADDPNFQGGAVSYSATTNRADITADIGRYFVGRVVTPGSGGAGTSANSGAGFGVIETGGDSWGDAVDSDIVPDGDGTRDLGTTAVRFAETYTDALDVTSNIVVGGTVDGRDIAADGAKVDGIVSAKPGGFEITGSQNLSTTEATLVFDSEGFDPDSNYALSSGAVTVTDAGYYHVSLNMPINDDGSGGATRSRAFVFIQRDQGSGTWVEPAPPIRGQDYLRETSGGSGLSASGIISLSAGEVVRWRADVSGTTDVSTETGETAFFIHRIR